MEEEEEKEGVDRKQGVLRPPGSSLERLQLAPLRRALPRWGPRGRGARRAAGLASTGARP